MTAQATGGANGSSGVVRRELAPQTGWPAKASLFGVDVSTTTYDEATEEIIASAHARRGACVSALAVHGVMTAAGDASFAAMLNRFELVVPDGQPVRYALNWLHRAGLPDRVYGPELTLRVCARAAQEGIGVFLYGSSPAVVTALAERLKGRFPTLRIVGREPSLFRPLTASEDDELVGRINESGAGIVFVGLGCPLQEKFASDHRDRVAAVQICVGAAFDFHAGTKPMAPQWMQRASLEWLFRLLHEPRRLWKRYALTNSAFVVRLARELVLGTRGSGVLTGGPRSGPVDSSRDIS